MALKELKVFDKKMYKIIKAIAETIIPPGGAFDVDPNVVDPALLFDNYLDSMSILQLKAIKTILYTIEYMPMFTRLKRFTKMSPEQRLKYLEGWETSRFFSKRGVLLLVKMLFLMSYYSDDTVAQAINYHPECLVKD
ncbi:MAG: hypothetical protein ACP5QW_04045 [bacterium]